jgi:hypothetical protein
MIRAAARGAVDFCRADPDDRRFWNRLALILDELENDDRLELLRMHHDRYVNLLARGDLTAESMDRLRGGHERLMAAVGRRLFPWETDEKDDIRTGTEQLRDRWVQAFGDPDDPKVAAAIDATVRLLESQRVDVRRARATRSRRP